MENIDLIYQHDHLVYTDITNFAFDSDRGMVWFTDKQNHKHQSNCRWHWYES